MWKSCRARRLRATTVLTSLGSPEPFLDFFLAPLATLLIVSSSSTGAHLRPRPRVGPGRGITPIVFRSAKRPAQKPGRPIGLIVDPFFQTSKCTWQPVTRKRLGRSEEHTSELQSRGHLVCRLLLEKKKHTTIHNMWSQRVGEDK